MALTAAGSMFVVFLFVAGVLSQSGWNVTYGRTEICALTRSSVDLACTFTHPSEHTVTKTEWFKRTRKLPDDDMSEYSARVELLYNEICTLTMTDLRENDTAEYILRLVSATNNYTGSPGVFLTVTDVLLEVSPMSVSEKETQNATLKCTTKCTPVNNTGFVWYKNRKLIQNSHVYSDSLHLGPVNTGEAVNYSCALKGHEEFSSPEVTLTGRYIPKNTSVSIRPSGEIVEGSSVILTCNSDANPPANIYTWYKKSKRTKTSSARLPEQGRHYVINNVSYQDSGEYNCNARSEMGAKSSPHVLLDVKFVPRKTSVSVSPSGKIAQGSSVTLTCNSEANPPAKSYTWYKNTVTLPWNHTQNYVIRDVNSTHSGEYTCIAVNDIGEQFSSPVSIDVRLNRTTPSMTVKHDSKSNTPVQIMVVLPLVVLFFLLGLLGYIKRVSKSTAEDQQKDSAHLYETILNLKMTPTTVQTMDTDEDNIVFANVHLSDPVNPYYTLQPHKPKKEEENQPGVACQTVEHLAEDVSVIYNLT